MFRAAIFDMDGLLIDSERAIMRAWINASRLEGVRLTQADYVRTVGLAMRESEHILVELLGGRERFASARVRVDALLSAKVEGPRYPLRPGARSLVDALRQAGVPLGVASSSAAAEVRHRLGEVGVMNHFHSLAGGDEVPRGKPDPAVYRLALERLGFDAADCLAFEDSENGTRAAMAAGLRVVVVPDLKPPPPDVLERSFCVLCDLTAAMCRIEQWFPGGLER